MTTGLEFFLVAVAIYLWECCLWIPLRGPLLRRSLLGRAWSALDPRALLVLRDRGLVIGVPVLADTGLAVCQSPPLVAGPDGSLWLDDGTGRWQSISAVLPADLRLEPPRLYLGTSSVPVVSPVSAGRLLACAKSGTTMPNAARADWTAAMSTGRAAREWRKWRLVSVSLRLFCPTLTLGFFVGLPLIYQFVGGNFLLAYGLWLYAIMLLIAGQLWWLGSAAYPRARSALRMDALFCLLVPFHAMAAARHAAVHALSACHPATLLLATGATSHPWLARFARTVLYPRPGQPGDVAFLHTAEPAIRRAFARAGCTPEDYDIVPDRKNDPAAEKFCPRCHGMFTRTATTCPDCLGLPLRDFADN